MRTVGDGLDEVFGNVTNCQSHDILMSLSLAIRW